MNVHSSIRVIAILLPLASAHAENRSYDGTGNSTGDRGAANRPFVRIAAADYANGTSSLAGQLRPNARSVSNSISAQSASEPNQRHCSDYVWQWGQFVDHDITLSRTDTGDSANIPVIDTEDVLYNEFFPSVPLTRTDYVIDAGNVRQQVNSISSFVDASNVYGSDGASATALRELSSGRMKTDGQGLLPFNEASLPMAGIGLVPQSELRMAGDVRANEQPGLAALHTLFVREHNRLAAEIETANPTWTDEEIYQRSRKINGAIIQSITYNEWLPALLGPHAPDVPSFTYDFSVDPTLSNEFATALFRFGHTMVSPQLMRIHGDSHLDATGSIDLMTAFFNPAAMQSPGDFEYILKGLACQLHQNADARIISELRNTLFGSAGSGGMDLAALNIQRGRDHGLADYNSVRTAYGLTPASTWSDISSDSAVQSQFGQAYADIDDIDLWNAALAEDHLPGAAVGETIATAIAAELTRLATGDVFFYLWDADLSPALRTEITRTTLGEVIARNTGLPVQQNVFFIPQPQLAFDELRHGSLTGLELNFMGEPGYQYRVNYGSSPGQMTGELAPSPLTTGDATYMMRCFDTDAINAPKRFYRISRTHIVTR
jgi:peroxidase